MQSTAQLSREASQCHSLTADRKTLNDISRSLTVGKCRRQPSLRQSKPMVTRRRKPQIGVAFIQQPSLRREDGFAHGLPSPVQLHLTPPLLFSSEAGGDRQSTVIALPPTAAKLSDGTTLTQCYGARRGSPESARIIRGFPPSTPTLCSSFSRAHQSYPPVTAHMLRNVETRVSSYMLRLATWPRVPAPRPADIVSTAAVPNPSQLGQAT